MKKTILVVLIAGTAGALALYVNRPASRAVAAAEPEPETTAAPLSANESLVPLAAAPPGPPAPRVAEAAHAARVEPAATPATPAAFDASLLRQTVDVLVSPQATFGQKQVAWNQLRAAGKLDAAIGDLEQRVMAEPRAAELPAALGQAYLQKCATLQDVREQGILGMQADKVFDTALALDPNNWEARFTKAVAMSYWPAFLNKGEEVVQHFQMLIQQQEAQPPQPHFAETYAWLGEQYQRGGRGEEARAIWERGAALFPNHEGLRKKLGSQR